MSNGRYPFAYSHYPSKGMWLLKHHPLHKGRVRLIDEDFEVSIGKVKAEDEYACLVATKKLTDEDWKKLEKKKLYIFRDGALLLKVDRKIKPMLDSEAIEILRAILNGESVELNGTVKRLLNLKFLKITENGVTINDYRRTVVRLIVGEEGW